MTLREARRERAVEALQAAVRIPTVSRRDGVDTEVFDALLAELERRFPLLHERLELTRVHTHGLLFRWCGASDAQPVVLMAHLDVVPIEDESRWTHPPFSGAVVDGVVWGRGTLDDKGCVVAICSAVEELLEDGHEPAQDVWLSFGCDEEVFGQAAPEAVAVLRERGVEPWFVLDEGGAVAGGAFPGVSAPVAVVGVTEKGVTSLLLRAEGRGGHASTPARNGPTARIAKAITALESSPMAPALPAPTVELFRRLGPHLPLPLRPVVAAAARVPAVLTRTLLAAGPETAAMVRTTFAVTTLEGSPALNVIAGSATAGVNIRVMVGDTVDSVLEHVRRAVGRGVDIEVVEEGEASPLSPYSTAEHADPAFDLLETTIGEVFPDAVPSPYVMMAGTDSRHFTEICERVYRFAPFRMSKAQREAIHSHDEHLGVEDFLDGVAWYRLLIERLPA
ncbi:M20/M25/M40 family metallo-hydrolase [uncultured Nocardioides sp.]|mgnify:FL=1|uniref:M20/M25/M40 family metallo-hydrolase n=1 Tax=uncultured Nocardioides sp. TaxID=198441 RepID=UPI002615E030|nr:M20/M25/M40 family metallo-hydrolase [uncultured Nocardioides sp.]